MVPRICISLVVLQLCTVFVFGADTDECISFKFKVDDSASSDGTLTLECKLEQCIEYTYLTAQSIRISKVKDGGDIPLASIELTKNLATGTSVLGKAPQVSGDLKGGDNSFLSISWRHPDKDLEMQYSCIMEVKDDYAKSRNYVARVNVVLDQPEPTEKPEPTDDPEDCPSQLEILNQKILELEGDHSGKDPQCPETGVQVDRLVEIFFKQPPLSYNNKRYYISAKPYLEDEQSDDLCNIVGGYLVEVNDAEEYKAVVRYIKSNNVQGALISGTDGAKEGAWVYHRSKRPVTYFNWMKGQPDNNKGRENCVIVWIEPGDVMNDVVCKGNPYRYPFICEVDK